MYLGQWNCEKKKWIIQFEQLQFSKYRRQKPEWRKMTMKSCTPAHTHVTKVMKGKEKCLRNVCFGWTFIYDFSCLGISRIWISIQYIQGSNKTEPCRTMQMRENIFWNGERKNSHRGQTFLFSLAFSIFQREQRNTNRKKMKIIIWMANYAN